MKISDDRKLYRERGARVTEWERRTRLMLATLLLTGMVVIGQSPPPLPVLLGSLAPPSSEFLFPGCGLAELRSLTTRHIAAAADTTGTRGRPLTLTRRRESLRRILENIKYQSVSSVCPQYLLWPVQWPLHHYSGGDGK